MSRQPTYTESRELGSASIEATISLVIFIFVIVGIYMLANFCIVQAKVAYAIDTTAKEMSQYSYFYHMLNLDNVKKGLGEKSQQALSAYEELSSLVQKSSSTVGEVTSSPDDYLAGLVKGEKTDDLNELYAQLQKTTGILSDAVNSPIDFMRSMAALAGDKAWDAALVHMAAPLASSLTRRHFGGSTKEASAYLEGMGVVGGYGGLNFNLSSLFLNGTDKVEVVVCYRLSLKNIIPNPALNQEVVICQKAVTDAWLGGDDPHA